MLHFRYFFTEIKTQTHSFWSLPGKKILKDDRHASHKDFLFIAVEKERQVFYRRQQNEKSYYSLISFFATLNALSKLINSWIMKLEGLV